jgi:RNA polymerase sigma-70 factor (ECF subfamily)
VGRFDVEKQIPFSSDFATPSRAARDVGGQAMGGLLESFRPYLLAIARRRLPGDLRGRYDPADLVQETLLKAHQGFRAFNGTDADVFRAWLCGILRHSLTDLRRRYCIASKRSVARERPLTAGPGWGDPGDAEVDPYPSPCAQSIAREKVEALRDALSRLPAHERSVIALRHFDFLSFEEIGQRLGCSSEAARKLCYRSMTRLRGLLRVTRGSEP